MYSKKSRGTCIVLYRGFFASIILILFVAAFSLLSCSLFNRDKDPNPNTSTDIEMEIALRDEGGVVQTGYYQGNQIEYELIGDRAVFHFDIVLDASLISKSRPIEFSRGTGRTLSTIRWPDRTVYYEFDSSFTQTANTEAAIEYYNDMGFNFIERTSETDYIDFIYINQDEGYWSSDIGRKGGRQEIHLANGYGMGTALHEIGHALGLWHENSRSDRDTNLSIDWANIKAGKEHNFNTYGENNCDGFDYKNFDWMSIMLYHSYSFAINRRNPTITRTDGTVYGTQRDALSMGDMKTLYYMYPHTTYVWAEAVRYDENWFELYYVNGSGSVERYFNTSLQYWGGFYNVNSESGVTYDRTTVTGGKVSAVSRADNFIDIFMTATNGTVWTAAWTLNDGWGGWWEIGGIAVTPGDYVAVASKGPNKLDVVAVRIDGTVYTAAWEYGVSGGAWRGWWPVNGGIALCGAEPALVSRKADQLDVFVIGLDGDVWTAASDESTSNGSWAGWWTLGSCGLAVTNVSAISSGANYLHVFATRVDGEIHSNEWDGSGWSGWSQVGTITAQPGTKVVPVSRKPGFVDIFVMGNDQHVYTAAWEEGRDSQNIYRGWWDLGYNFTPGTHLAAVSGSENTLNVIGISGNGNAFWSKRWENNAWQDWELVEYNIPIGK